MSFELLPSATDLFNNIWTASFHLGSRLDFLNLPFNPSKSNSTLPRLFSLTDVNLSIWVISSVDKTSPNSSGEFSSLAIVFILSLKLSPFEKYSLPVITLATAIFETISTENFSALANKTL